MIIPRHLLAIALVVAQGFPVLAQGPAPVSGSPATTRVEQVPRTTAPRWACGKVRGTAVNSTNAMLAKAVVRLRNTRNGRITHQTLTDESGTFTFGNVEPSNSVVELVDGQEVVLAASPLITVDACEVVSTTVKLPIKIPALFGLLGNNAAAAAIVAATAAAAGVLSVRVGECVSPPCEN